MQANKELINAFRQVAQKLEEQPNIWYWGNYTKCNCGLVAQQLGVPENTIMSATNSYADWSHFSREWAEADQDLWNTTCPVTDLRVQEVISTLEHYGLSPDDMVELEHCLAENEREETVDELINYFWETADRLEIELLNKSAEVQKETQSVKV